jgi:molybdenum cofactor cytidylyltransferase
VSDVVRAVVLAGGEGRRFGGPKQLATVDGKALVLHAVDLARPWDPVVVLGARADRIRPVLPLDVDVVIAHDWAEGQSASLRTGVAELDPDVDWALVLLADMPYLTREAVEAVLAARDGDEPVDAVRATYDGRPGHPVLLGRAVLDAVPDLHGDTGARELLARFRVRTLEAAHLCDATDIDTPDQLERPS